MTDVSLDGRRFRSVHNEDGEVGAETTFEYHEEWTWDSREGSGTSVVEEVAGSGRA